MAFSAALLAPYPPGISSHIASSASRSSDRSRSLRESASDWLESEPSPLVTITTRAPALSLGASARVRSSGARTLTAQISLRGAW